MSEYCTRKQQPNRIEGEFSKQQAESGKREQRAESRAVRRTVPFRGQVGGCDVELLADRAAEADQAAKENMVSGQDTQRVQCWHTVEDKRGQRAQRLDNEG
jgi:hypothetical protein